jgi:prepilin peptidase CpaA
MIEDMIFIIFPTLMIFAAISDLLMFKISNRIPLLLFFGYVVIAVSSGFSVEQVAQDFLCGLVVLLISIVLFNFKLLGGGDAKLAAATAFWLGWENLFSYGMVASLVGFLLSLAIVGAHFSELPQWLLSMSLISRLADKSNGVPLGVALAVGGLVVYPQTKIWSYVSAHV